MSRLPLFRSLIAAALLFFCFTVTQAQDNLSVMTFKSEPDQVSFSLRKEIQPAIAEIVFQIYTLELKEVYQQQAPANQPLVWPMKDSSGKPAQDPIYLCAIGLKPPVGQPYIIVGRITQQADNGREFSLLEERPNNLPGPKPEEFHQWLVQKMPNNGVAWFFYGLAAYQKHEGVFGYSALSLTPPPPPPAAPPPPATGKVLKPIQIQISKEEQKRIDEEEKQWQAKKAAFQEDLKVIQPAFLKAVELAADCQIKDTAMAYLAAIASDFERNEEYRQWLLKRLESSCATNVARAETYYALGVNQWSCAYRLANKYENAKLKYSDPFHFRAITNPADKRQFESCLAACAAYIEKALETDAGYSDAMFYKSLLYREKQKTTANPVERKKLADEAAKISKRAVELMNQRSK